MKFVKNIFWLGFWILIFDDEYVDYVSLFSLCIICYILIFGILIFVFWGDSRWFVEVIVFFEIINVF